LRTFLLDHGSPLNVVSLRRRAVHNLNEQDTKNLIRFRKSDTREKTIASIKVIDNDSLENVSAFVAIADTFGVKLAPQTARHEAAIYTAKRLKRIKAALESGYKQEDEREARKGLEFEAGLHEKNLLNNCGTTNAYEILAKRMFLPGGSTSVPAAAAGDFSVLESLNEALLADGDEQVMLEAPLPDDPEDIVSDLERLLRPEDSPDSWEECLASGE